MVPSTVQMYIMQMYIQMYSHVGKNLKWDHYFHLQNMRKQSLKYLCNINEKRLLKLFLNVWHVAFINIIYIYIYIPYKPITTRKKIIFDHIILSKDMGFHMVMVTQKCRDARSIFNVRGPHRSTRGGGVWARGGVATCVQCLVLLKGGSV